MVRLGVIRLALWRVPGSLWMLLGFLLAWVLMVPSAHAETCSNGVCTQPATSSPATITKLWPSCYGNNCSGTLTAAAACAATTLMGAGNGPCVRYLDQGSQIRFCIAGWDDGICAYYGKAVNPSGQLCGTTQQAYGAACTGSTYSCPAGEGWTLSGQNCTRPACPSGQVRWPSGGTCYEPCTPFTGEPYGGGISREYHGTGNLPDTTCLGGCQLDLGSTFGGYGSGKWWARGIATYTGKRCVADQVYDEQNPSAPPITNTVGSEAAEGSPESKCITSGQGFGTVNGVVVCTGPVEQTKQTTKETVRNTPASGPGSTTEKTTTTICNVAGACTTTVSSTVTSGGANADGTGAGSSTAAGDGKSTTEAKSVYCAKNNNAAGCAAENQGKPAGTGELYEEGTRTVSDVLSEFKTAVSAAPVVAAATNYFAGSLPSGSCSGLSLNVSALGKSWVFDPGSVLCGSFAASVYTVLGIGVMLAAGWVAFRVAIL